MCIKIVDHILKVLNLYWKNVKHVLENVVKIYKMQNEKLKKRKTNKNQKRNRISQGKIK